MLREDVLLEEKPLLIVTRRDPICTFLGLALLTYRARRGLYTHIAHVDTLLSPSVQDLAYHYDNIVSLDLAETVEGDIKHRISKHNIVLEIVSERTFQKIYNLVEKDSEARTFLEIAAAMYYIEYGNAPVKISTLENVDLPPLPGVTYRSLSESLAFSLWPYVPQMSGDLDRASRELSRVSIDPERNLKELDASQADKLILLIVELYDKNRCLLKELDKLTLKTYLAFNELPVQDIYLVAESSYVLDSIGAFKLRDILKGVKLLQLKTIRDSSIRYINTVKSVVDNVMRGERVILDSLTLAIRVYRVLRTYRKRGVNVKVRIHESVICYVSDQRDLIEKCSSKTLLRLPDNIVIECAQL